jgi:hypothetical protein
VGLLDDSKGLTRTAFEARVLGFIALSIATLGVVFCLPTHPQDPNYHAFADGRPMLGVPNFLNVISNFPFVVVGALGLWLLLRYDAVRPAGPFLEWRERAPLLVLFSGVLLTGFGSAYYHLRPDNDRLVWDRLPMTVAFMGFFASMIGEQISIRAGAWLLGPLVWLGIASVLTWHWEQIGRGDLRLYGFVQFYPMLATPLLIFIFPTRYTRAGDIFVALAWYLLARGLDQSVVDHGVFDQGEWISGHTLKHLSAAAGAYCLFLRVRFRHARSATFPHGQHEAAPFPYQRRSLSMRLARKILGVLWRALCVVSWCLLGLWTALALYFNVPLSRWPAAVLSLAIVVLYACALRERSLLGSWKGLAAGTAIDRCTSRHRRRGHLVCRLRGAESK